MSFMVFWMLISFQYKHYSKMKVTNYKLTVEFKYCNESLQFATIYWPFECFAIDIFIISKLQSRPVYKYYTTFWWLITESLVILKSHFTKDCSSILQIWWKITIFMTQLLAPVSLQNFACTMRAQLSYHIMSRGKYYRNYCIRIWMKT